MCKHKEVYHQNKKTIITIQYFHEAKDKEHENLVVSKIWQGKWIRSKSDRNKT